MSWEEMSVNQYKCPCGSGTYTVRWFMDDWNRSEERWEMDCPVCMQKYQIYVHSYWDSGMQFNAYLWVPRESYEKIEEIERQLERTKEEIVNLEHSRYMDAWLSYFNTVKTKKEVWRILTDDGKRYPSLSTFYSDVRDSDLRHYLREYFSYDNLAFVLKKLKIEDKEIDEKILHVKEIESMLDDMREQLKKEGYK